jgi:hypothetical protein
MYSFYRLINSTNLLIGGAHTTLSVTKVPTLLLHFCSAKLNLHFRLLPVECQSTTHCCAIYNPAIGQLQWQLKEYSVYCLNVLTQHSFNSHLCVQL